LGAADCAIFVAGDVWWVERYAVMISNSKGSRSRGLISGDGSNRAACYVLSQKWFLEKSLAKKKSR
jgi:hypothetical protein